uniref:Uncharacterized protein n=1 Tax=Sinocyclocheilus rhinocerous TaxID=307959 RepID=A0A673GDY6_9TELE
TINQRQKAWRRLSVNQVDQVDDLEAFDPSLAHECDVLQGSHEVWGGVGGVALVHFSDWRLILDYVPYINGKFKKDD